MKKIVNETMCEERVAYMDIVKALTIILVVVGHSGSPIRNFIYLFHIAVFFCISGYFYKDSYSSHPLKLIKRRLKTLYVPFILYEFLFLALHNVFYNFNIYSNKIIYFGQAGYLYGLFDYLKNIFYILTFHNTEQLLKPFWFLVVLFVINMLFSFISYISLATVKKYSEIVRASLIGLCFALGMVLSHFKIVLSFNTNIALVAILVYYFGYLYKKYESYIRFNGYFILFSFALLVINSFFGLIEMSSNTYTSPWYFIINSLLGIYFMFGISKFISLKKGKWLDFLKYIGLNTIPILALQLLCFKIVSFLEVLIYHYPRYMLAKFLILDGSHGWWIAYSFVGLFGPLLIIYFFGRIKNIGSKIFVQS
jgi:fucose 4-O-acetylase-like acetyltransferase